MRAKSAAPEKLRRGASDAVLMANYSGVTGGEVSAGKSALWCQDGRLVAASAGAEEALVVGVKQDGVWNGIVLPVS